jgi:hypothetical protein
MRGWIQSRNEAKLRKKQHKEGSKAKLGFSDRQRRSVEVAVWGDESEILKLHQVNMGRIRRQLWLRLRALYHSKWLTSLT